MALQGHFFGVAHSAFGKRALHFEIQLDRILYLSWTQIRNNSFNLAIQREKNNLYENTYSIVERINNHRTYLFYQPFPRNIQLKRELHTNFGGEY